MFLQKIFKLQKYNTNLKTEFIAGLTTFITASWILFVNPIILGKTGMDIPAVFFATIIMLVIGASLMGFYANLPIIIGPSLSSNTWFAYTIVLILGYTWQQGLAAVLFDGILFFLFSITGLRTILINAFSKSLRVSISIGIGLFIMSIGLKISGFIVASDTDNISKMGDLLTLPVISTILGIMIILFLESKNIKFSLLASIFLLSIIGFTFKETTYTGIIALPNFSNITFLNLDFSKTFSISFWSVVFSLLLLDVLTSTGGLMSLIEIMKLPMTEKRVKKAMANDGLTTASSSLFGCSPSSVYIESATGIASGGKTGLTAIIFAIMSLSMIFFSPLLTIIPKWASSPALIYIGYLMFKSIKEIQWNDITEAFPAFITIILMPLTSSITNGIAVGIFFWLVMALFTKKFDIKKHWILLVILLSYLIFFEK